MSCFFDCGERETLKCFVHASLGALALVCTVYNAISFARRAEAHLAANTLVYGALVALEIRKCQHHREAERARRGSMRSGRVASLVLDGTTVESSTRTP